MKEKHLCKKDGLVCSNHIDHLGQEKLTLEYPFDVEYDHETCEEMRGVDVIACPFCGYKKDDG